MLIYIVMSVSIDNTKIPMAAFTSMDAANKYIKTHKGWYAIVALELDNDL